MKGVPMQLGHVNIFVRNAELSEKFYTEAMGLTVMYRRGKGNSFLSAYTVHSHEIALIEVGDDAPRPEKDRVGLNHMAWQMATFEDLKTIYKRLKEYGADIIRVVDHKFSMGIYLNDPDGNGIEVYYELPLEDWPRGEGDERFSRENPFPYSLEDESEVASPRRVVTVTTV